MKKLRISVLLVLYTVALTLFAAEVKWGLAVNAARNSEGSDAAIEEALSQYGYDLNWDDLEPSMIVKVKTLLK